MLQRKIHDRICATDIVMPSVVGNKKLIEILMQQKFAIVFIICHSLFVVIFWTQQKILAVLNYFEVLFIDFIKSLDLLWKMHVKFAVNMN